MRTKTNIEKTLVVLAFFFFFFSGFAWAQTQTEPTLEQKLDEVAGTTTKSAEKKEAKTEKPPATSAVNPDDSNLSEHDRKVALLAKELELRNQYKKLEAEKTKLQTPEEKKAEKVVTKQEKNEQKAQASAAETLANAQITGCPANSVGVSPNAEPWHYVTRIYPSAVVRILNTGALPINEISGPKGVLATNLCSGGAMTMTFYLDFLDSDQVNVPLTAIARTPDGGVATAQFSVYLNRYTADYQRVSNLTWEVRLQRQQQTR